MPSTSRRHHQAEEEEEEEESEEEHTQNNKRRRRQPAEEESDEEEALEEVPEEMDVDGDEADSQDQVVKKLVRYALACEYQRVPIKRANITEKVMSKQRVPFKRVFELAQMQLKHVFGMQMVELPGKEKFTLKERRAAQKTKGASKTSTSWILTTILPSQYRNPAIVPPAPISSTSEEAAYIALCTVIVAVIQLNPTNSIPDHKLVRYLNRMNAAENMPMDKTANVLSKMQRQGYIVKTVDRSGDDETIDWRVGPRGKVEIGNRGIEGLVKAVYGEAPPEDLQSRIDRSLGMDIARGRGEDEGEEAEDEPEPEAEQSGGPSRRRSRRRNADDD
ncbi:hypothetical protein D0Z07_1727 [Hyphodiscus hymeniophilus]|uniref:MAGE domain-containing protein n=1 Tax=Hyphodiscus hymeniophilus TaxID=353542 RepID=A0A9P6VP14_9HELO|nr:hypothetical protein D0Z07_1727 [Hyphodiscus hymeniophilus]